MMLDEARAHFWWLMREAPVLITVPPMAAAFFQGTIGQFMAYNAFEQGRAMVRVVQFEPLTRGLQHSPHQACGDMSRRAGSLRSSIPMYYEGV